MSSCCSKHVCNGCNYANQKREREGRLQHKCPFCRKAVPSTEEEFNKRLMRRVEVNDPVAMCDMATERYEEGDYKSACDYWNRAAVLGNMEAHYQLSILYQHGLGVEKDEKRELRHLEEAAIGGNPTARYNLGNHEWNNDNSDRAVRHWIIAAAQGHDESIKELMNEFESGVVSKEDLASALRAHKGAKDSTKSPQRDEAEGRM